MESLLKRFQARRTNSKQSAPSAKSTKVEPSDSTPKENGTTNGAPQENGTPNGAPNGYRNANGITHETTSGERPLEPQKPSMLEQTKRTVSESVVQLRTLLKASQSPLPTQTGDGSALPQQETDGFWKDVNEIIRDISRPDIKDVEGLIETVKLTALGQPMDDKEYLMESVRQPPLRCLFFQAYMLIFQCFASR